MPLNPKFQKFTTTSPTLINIDGADLVIGTGTVSYFAVSTQLETTLDYILTRSSVFSDTIGIQAEANSSSAIKVIDIDFDLSQFNTPQTIEGTAFLQIPFAAIYSSGGGGTRSSAFVIAKLIHYDGSTETILATAQTKTETNPSSATTATVALVNMDIARKLFRSGDILRLTIEGWCKRVSGTANPSIGIGHDPQNRDGVGLTPSSDSEVTTTLKIDVPFRIDL